MPIISVIVPIYNSEKYLSRCLDSVKNQTFTDWECILVNDGSTDSSGVICNDYAGNDCRFSVINKQNGGVSAARNCGIDQSSGDWIMFVDADDVISPETLEIAVKSSQEDNLDIFQFSFSNNESDLNLNDISFTDVCTLEEYIAKDKVVRSACGSLIDANIINGNRIRFNEQMKLGEDQLFIYTCLLYAKRIKRIPNILYCYFDNPTSATKVEKPEDIIYSSDQCVAFKRMHPEFVVRMDDLVLYYIEKLLLRREYSASYRILSNLRPTLYESRPWPTKLMARTSKCNTKVAVVLGAICYPLYIKTRQLLSRVKQFLKKR